MQRSITLKLVIEVKISKPIEDYSLSEIEIDNLANETIAKALPSDRELDYKIEHIEHKWTDEPRWKEHSPVPSEENWVKINGIKWAAKSSYAVSEKCRFRFHTNRSWHLASESIGKVLENNLSEPFQDYGIHPGRFSNDFKALLGNRNLKVVGKDRYSIGFVLLKNELIAIVMPVKNYKLQPLSDRQSFSFDRS